MKILIISQEFPYPPSYTGAKLKLYNLLKYLSKKNEIYLISFIGSKEELDYVPKIKEFCSLVDTVPRNLSPSHNIIQSVFSKYPRDAFTYFSNEMEAKTLDIIKTYNIDIVHLDLIYMAQYADCICDLPKVIAPYDVNWILWNDVFRLEKNLIARFRGLVHYLRLRRFEIDFYRKFDHCIVVSPKDKKALEACLPKLKISIIPNGVDFDYFKALDKLSVSHNLIFTGVMSYKPNIDAMRYFCKKVLPLIKNEIQDIKLYIVGKDPAEKIKQLASKEVIVTGYVDSIRDYVKEASVYVCPLRMGSGIKNKILEAMAMGIPIVATSLSIEGIEAVQGRDIIVADKPEEFAKSVIDLISDEGKRSYLAENAKKLVQEKYNWEKVITEFEKMYENVIKTKEKN